MDDVDGVVDFRALRDEEGRSPVGSTTHRKGCVMEGVSGVEGDRGVETGIFARKAIKAGGGAERGRVLSIGKRTIFTYIDRNLRT